MKSLAIALLVVAVAAQSGDKVIPLSHLLIAELPRVSAKVRTHGSAEEATYEGVTLAALLAKAGVPSGEAIRGDKLSLVVIAKAADGYSAVYALAELDPAFSKKMFLLADRKNGAPLPA